MKSSSFLRYQTALFAFLLLTGCGGEPTPEYYGIFAIQNGKFIDLSKDDGKFSLELDPDAKFLVYDKSIAELINSAKLVPLVYVRNKMITNVAGKIVRVDEVKVWTSDNSSAAVLRAQPAKKNQEIAYLSPKEPLRPGVYMLKFEASPQRKEIETGAFFVGEPSNAEYL